MRSDWGYTRNSGPQRRKSNSSAWTQLLNNVRLEKRETQAQLAARADVNQSYVSKVERGDFGRLNKRTILTILDKYFGSSLDAQLLEAVKSSGLLEQEAEPAPQPRGHARTVVLGSPRIVRYTNRRKPWSTLLNRIRIEKQLTQGDVAAAAGVDRITVSRAESGKLNLVSRRTLARILSEYCGSTLDGELLTALRAARLVERAGTLLEALAELKIR